MAQKMIFLSHIHEEKALALKIKEALENEFAGFVDVFVSSDGVSIPAGANFLKRIETGLTDCIGAIYLISPASVKRNWINFELGAVWVRNVISQRDGNQEIPAIPVCHSGSTPGTLPSPLNNLNGIIANQASQLEFAFRSLQLAVGGRGQLRTDFDALANQVVAFEADYTLGASVVKMLDILGGTEQKRALVRNCEKLGIEAQVDLGCGFVETNKIQILTELQETALKEHVRLVVENPGTSFLPGGAVNGAELTVVFAAGLILRFKDLIE